MFLSWQWIIILVILAVVCILSSSEDKYYKDYDCYKKSFYKCKNCRKKCKWKYIAKNFEKEIEDRENGEID